MPQCLCLSATFLNPEFHGRGDTDAPEWPPSPLRLFQAIVAGIAAHDGEMSPTVEAALGWLESQPVPEIIAPPACKTAPYRLSVPNNAMDLVAKAWCRGVYEGAGDSNPATHRAMKTVAAMRMVDGDTVYYLWALPEALDEELREHIAVLCVAMDYVVALGWGIDMVVCRGSVRSVGQVAALAGDRWVPHIAAVRGGLRTPSPGTLGGLAARHRAFLSRINGERLASVPALTIFNTMAYYLADGQATPPFTAFVFRKTDNLRDFRAFNSAGSGLTVAAMMRFAAKNAAKANGWPDERIANFILGHNESRGETHQPVGLRRFVYLPLPTIEFRGTGRNHAVGDIRRGIIACFADGCSDEIQWASQMLGGRDLISEKTGESQATLVPLKVPDPVVQRYILPANIWATVTPVVLPGFDDPAHYRRRIKKNPLVPEKWQWLAKLDTRVDELIRKAIRQAGHSQESADNAAIEWRKVGFWPGLDLADRYGVPDHLKRFPRFHVRITWRNTRGMPIHVPGPICIGGGRYAGLGLFAGVDG